MLSRAVIRFAALIAASVSAGAAASIWSVQELTFIAARHYENPFSEVALSAEFTGPDGAHIRVNGYADGDRIFKVRWTPEAAGTWRYQTRSSDPGLNGKTGKIRVSRAEPGQHGFLRRDPAYPHSFVFDDGSRYFLFGNTMYGLVANAVAGDGWKTAVDKTREIGMNKIRFNISRQSIEGKHTSRPDLPAFQKLDEVVRYLANREIIADFIIFTQNQINEIDKEQAQKFLRYVVARYGAFPNVIWCLQNEWQYTNKKKPFWTELGESVSAEDPWAKRGLFVRGLSVHQQTRYDWEFFQETWYSHVIIQLGVRNRGNAQRGGNEWNLPKSQSGVFRFGDDWGNFGIVSNYGRKMPVVNDEYGYIGEPKDESQRIAGKGDVRYSREKHRRTAWGIYAGGGYGSAGDKNYYQDIGQPYKSANWHDEPEFGDIKRLVHFFTSKGLEYWKMGPKNDIVKAGTRVYALAEPGKQYVIYAAAGGSFTIDLEGGPYEIRRYDPRTGNDVLIEKAVSAGSRSFLMPDSEDWVVYCLKRR